MFILYYEQKYLRKDFQNIVYNIRCYNIGASNITARKMGQNELEINKKNFGFFT